jgi:hypothetical protein
MIFIFMVHRQRKTCQKAVSQILKRTEAYG